MRRIRTFRGHALLLAAAVGAVALTTARAAAAQNGRDDADPPLVLVTAWSGFSMREGQSTFRFADDLVTYGLRASLNRRAGARLWIQLDRFERPGLVCPGALACNADGFLARAGATLPLTRDDTRPGFHPRLVGGVGAGFSEETALSYLLGLGAIWTIHPRFGPVFEVRWERVPGLSNILVLAAGLRVGLF